MKLKKEILIILFCCSIWFLFQNVCYAGSQRLNSLDYQVKLKENGNMDVIETWDIYISETNTLFKDFKLDSSKYTGIINVKVKNLTTNEELTQIDQEMYHVTKDCYYGLETKSNQFEIAWGVGLDNSSETRRYQISYTVEDAITVYQDCSQLYWQFVGTDNGMRARKVTGTIELPKSVNDLEKLRVWAHGPLNGEIYKMTNDLVTFHVDDLDVETMLEVRIAVEEPMFTQALRTSTQKQLDKIITEENKWADSANRERKKGRAIFGLAVIVYLAVLAFLVKKILNYRKELNTISENKYQVDIGEYFRDIPREKEATPAEAAFLYYWNRKMPENVVFSATMLQLCLKGYLSFEMENKNDIKINLIKPTKLRENNLLKTSEEDVMKVLQRAAGYGHTSLTMKDLKSYARREYEEFGITMSGLEIDAKNEHSMIGNFNTDQEKYANQYKTKLTGFVIGMMMLMMFSPILQIALFPILIECILCIVIIRKIIKKVNVLTEQGEIERQQWKGLKRYMEDFSLLKDREIPDLVLWEKYLVYATAFGISDKVIKQLKVVYPQMSNLDSNTYTYMYLVSNSRFSNGFIDELNRGTNSAYSAYRTAYNAAHSVDSSGSGGGGGFSSGGGGRWRWRPEWAEDKYFLEWRKRMKIGIDIGGSHIGIGLIEEARIIESKEKNLDREARKNIEQTILISIQEMITELLAKVEMTIEQIEMIGIAAPGTISSGVIVKAGNLKIENFAILSDLKKIYQNPLQIRNDGKCAALAEKRYGAMKDYDDCVFINIGTGIGGAAFLNGKLLEPKRYSGFEFGHMVLNKGGRLCSCGKQGCFETYSSIKALKMKVTETLDVDSDISGQYLREKLLCKDDPRVREDIDVFLDYLKTGISNLIDIFEPEIVCLGGSFAYYEGHPIFNQLIEKLKAQNVTFNSGDLPKIVLADLKNDAGMIGAVIE